VAITFNYYSEENIFYCKSSGFDENLEEVIQYELTLLEAFLKSGCKKALSDERDLKYTLDITDSFSLGQFLSEQVKFPAKLALVTSVINKEYAEFWETVVTNRGLSVKVFYTMD